MSQCTINFDNSFQKLPAFLYEHVAPTPLKKPTLIHVTGLKKELGLESLSDSDLQKWLNGETRLSNDQTIATRYAGHQFGSFAGQLGDGRAISLGEILTSDGKRLEIQTKGSGKTPFSRMGDGKAVIRSSVREYLCSEAMHGLGIPTSRVLAIIIGEDKVYRETIERSAIVARVFPSNIRFGHFEMCYHYDRKAVLKDLIEYTRHTFFEGVSVEEMLVQIIDNTAMLMAHWQNVGFCHGVMNTDNMSVLGITIDYGPFGFLEDTHLSHVCNHSDYNGRYAYNNQPSIAAWNLQKLLLCFSDHLPKERLQNLLKTFSESFHDYYQKLCQGKLGLTSFQSEDYQIFSSLLQTLSNLAI
ncbi:protein adenylyltransferase SelO family protein, partial [Ferruginibacter sp.]|uniref:protein adenylyltransferase SelO family protein n=1 Tax=Ferruginibacter sp. TaxID=1940288 RepID=UPI0019960B4C